MVETKLLTCKLGPRRSIILSDKPPNIMELISKENEIPPVSDLHTVKVLIFSQPITPCLFNHGHPLLICRKLGKLKNLENLHRALRKLTLETEKTWKT